VGSVQALGVSGSVVDVAKAAPMHFSAVSVGERRPGVDRDAVRAWSVHGGNAMGQDGEFLIDVEEIRRRAHEHILHGAVTPGNRVDVDTLIALLNEVLATEIVCVLRYKRHWFTAEGILSDPIADQFREHAKEEEEHADRVAARIGQLGGEPNFDPQGLASRSHSQYVQGSSLIEMIQEDLIAERIAIESYSDIVRWIGDRDPTSRRMMEEILAREEEHADDMRKLLSSLDPARPPTRG
jgi:bacterioferritin